LNAVFHQWGSKAWIGNLNERLRPAPTKTTVVFGKRDAPDKFTSNGKFVGLRDILTDAVAKLTR
jgi:hypothetical protein